MTVRFQLGSLPNGAYGLWLSDGAVKKKLMRGTGRLPKMSNHDARIALDQAIASMVALTRALDHAAVRAVDIDATDILERVEAAKSAARRGTDCLAKIRSDFETEKTGDLSASAPTIRIAPRN